MENSKATKYFILLPDGMSDYPCESLDGLTPMKAAYKPCMDALAKEAFVGTVLNVPEGMVPESDTANLSVLSYDPREFSKGRAPLEAVSMGISMSPDDTAFRCNFVTLSEDGPYESKTMIDNSADQITTEEAAVLINALNDEFSNEFIKFYTGVSYRHCTIIKNGPEKYDFVRPHDIIGQCISDKLPSPDDEGVLFLELMKRSYDILSDHPINESRRARGLLPANSIWFWSPGKKPMLPSFKEKWGLDASVISAVDLIKGIALCADMTSIDVEGATGNFDTNYAGKANAAISAFSEGKDLVYVHIEAPDECGHRAETENKKLSIERIDSDILAPVYEYLKSSGYPFKILVLPDHPTPVSLRTHSSEPVPFLLYDSSRQYSGVECFCEESAVECNNFIPDGCDLMGMLTTDDDLSSVKGRTASPEIKKKKKDSFLKNIFDFTEMLVFAVCVVIVLFSFVFRLCRVDGQSMDHTLANGEMLLVSSIAYTPQISDIIVFHNTGSELPSLNEPIVKRIIAVGGQWIDIDFDTWTVRVADNAEMKNAITLEEDYRYVDPNVQLITSSWEYPLEIPDGYVFVMGDNRNHSTDSRSEFIGLVDERRILGKVILRITPFEKFGAVN